MADLLESWIGTDVAFNIRYLILLGKVVKKMKKVIALMTAILFVLGISVVSFAAETVKPGTTAPKAVEDKAAVKKMAVEDKATAEKKAVEDKAAAKKKAAEDKKAAKKKAAEDKKAAKKKAAEDKAAAKKMAVEDKKAAEEKPAAKK
jgi:hypothetical protein